MSGKLETVRTLVELGVDKEAKTKVRNLMMMVMMMVMMMMMMFYLMTGHSMIDFDYTRWTTYAEILKTFIGLKGRRDD